MSAISPGLPLLDYAPPDARRHLPLPLFTAWAFAGYTAFFLFFAACFGLAAHLARPDILPLIPVVIVASVTGMLEPHPTLRAVCAGMFAAVLTVCVPIAAVYLLLITHF